MSSTLSRHQFLTMLAAGAAGAAAAMVGSALAEGDPPPSGSPGGPPSGSGGSGSALPSTATPAPPLLPPPPGGPKTRLSRGAITALPGPGRSLALTVDDGSSPEVVGAYIRFARDTGARFTFFVTAYYDSWTIHRDALRPLVESGQIQLANHTWDHAALTKLSPAGVADQLNRAKAFLHNTFGVDGTPYFRPPFGYHDPTVDRVAADCGYTVPTMWYGSLSDAQLVTEDYIRQMAHQYFNPQTIVIGHANHPPVTHCYNDLVALIKDRNLSMVTLNDVLLPPA
ncbi:polysaccharide deacetylase family protein [Nocardia sp. CDC159]|uniref:Polysaccharide deacetylase family protein n=1 Tax=Nocardia pulmonis TaxID=2951408 RepID=A0A9X2EBY7_9NOCA|nr:MULTISPECIES: polysaccharide deacetylase family protein [Nocardia]MCM6777500.1 polysaccharide deacetylase family protein [Nocardia pulmonis]MCM6790393.1 polysaccharide deacetylase family protein [Nocardia sp. CDC159]